ISPYAFELCLSRANDRLIFKLQDFLQEQDVYFDVILLIDLIEHIENFIGFLRNIKTKSRYKILHIPLDISVQTALRKTPITFARKTVGHIQYFTKDIALEALRDVG